MLTLDDIGIPKDAQEEIVDKAIDITANCCQANQNRPAFTSHAMDFFDQAKQALMEERKAQRSVAKTKENAPSIHDEIHRINMEIGALQAAQNSGSALSPSIRDEIQQLFDRLIPEGDYHPLERIRMFNKFIGLMHTTITETTSQLIVDNLKKS